MNLSFNDSDIRSLIESPDPTSLFDLILVTPLSPMGLYLSGYVFKAPTAVVFPALRWAPIDVAMGNPTNPAYLPIELLEYGPIMSLKERVINTIARYSTVTTVATKITNPITHPTFQVPLSDLERCLTFVRSGSLTLSQWFIIKP